MSRNNLQGRARRLRVAAIGSTSAMGTLMIASGASGAVLFLTMLGSAVGSSSTVGWLQPISSTGNFGTVRPSTSPTPTPTPTPPPTTVTQPGTGPTSPLPGGAGPRAMKLGVNLEIPIYYGGARVFSNLILQSPWWLVSTGGSWTETIPGRLDRNQNLIKLAAGESAVRVISPPTQALLGKSVPIVCRWSGRAKVWTDGSVVRDVKMSANSLTFTFVPNGDQSGYFKISDLDAGNPIRNIDCRETSADPQAVYDPAFVQTMSQYNTLRFVKWQPAVEANKAVTWAGRALPTANSYISPVDGVPIERMVQLANLTKTNPWFCIPWNADAEYVRKFAEYVRDNLDPALVAYVELSNEVWNAVYPVHAQVLAEGRARNLASDYGTIVYYRHAQRTGEVMDVWKSVFASNPKRIVRVLATQNAIPWAAKTALSYKDTATKVDALATAPYFDWHFATTGTQPPADFFSKRLVSQMDTRLASAAENKAIAAEKGLRFIAYEGGQHVTISGGADVPMLAKLQRDARMGDLYTRYLTKWKGEFGDLMVLFSGWGPISTYGAWGMQEYLGQPLSAAPKAQAVDAFRRSHVTKN